MKRPIPASARLLTAAVLLAAQRAGGVEPDYRVEPIPADPLAGSPPTNPAATGMDVEKVFASLLPPRTDSPLDWNAGPEPLHHCREPRALPPCVPPPPCHPSEPPDPYDLVGAEGRPSGGPIYRGPCEPRIGSRCSHRAAWFHWLPDRLFDLFYATK